MKNSLVEQENIVKTQRGGWYGVSGPTFVQYGISCSAGMEVTSIA